MIATSGSFVWMKEDGPHGDMATYLANELEPVPQNETIPPPPPEAGEAFKSPAAVPLGGAHLPGQFNKENGK